VGAIGLLVHRLAAPDDGVIGEDRGVTAFPGRHFVPVVPPRWPPFGRNRRYTAGVLRAVNAISPALVEVHNRAEIATTIARARPTTPVTLFVHNDPQAMRGARQPAERAALLRRMAIVCASRYLATRFLQDLPDDGGAPVVLPNALDLATLPPARPSDEREKLILFAGRVVADKGADCFVRACASVLPGLPGWRAAVIGADRFWANSAATPFQQALAPLANAAGIEMRGYLPHMEVLRAMAAAAIVVAPSRWAEPFGLTALEALASGAALICSDRGGLPEVAGDAALYADPDAPGELEAAIRRLASDPALRGGLAVAGLARAKLFDAVGARVRLAELRRRVVEP
jgi:glycosyltransferase involved in cell wall biosynthesis